MNIPLVDILPVVFPLTCPLRFFGIVEKRKAEAERIRQKYPDRIPVRLFCSWY